MKQNTNNERKSFKEVLAENKGKICYINKREPNKGSFFWPTFVRTKMGLAHFLFGFHGFRNSCKSFWPTFFGFWPTFIFKTGPAETQ